VKILNSMRNLAVIMCNVFILIGCKKAEPLHIYPINERFNNQFYTGHRIVQYFYIDNQPKTPVKYLYDSISSFGQSQFSKIELKSEHYFQYFYKKKCFKSFGFSELRDFSTEGDPPSIYGNKKNLICQIWYSKRLENPIIYDRRLILYNKNSIVYEKTDLIVIENNNVKVLNEKEFSSTYETPRR